MEWEEVEIRDFAWSSGSIALHEAPCQYCGAIIPLITSENEVVCQCGRSYRIEYIVKVSTPHDGKL